MTAPNSARIWNYWQGGEHNYAVDREAGNDYLEVFPAIRDIALQDRQFLDRAVHYLSAGAGVDQFLEIGPGLPPAESTHQILHALDPHARMVLVDHDPLVLSHARTLLADTPAAPVVVVEADMLDPEDVLRKAADTLDLTRPVAVLLVGTIGHAGDFATAEPIVRRLLDGVPSGSYLALNQPTDTDPGWARAQDAYNATGAMPYHLYSPEEIEELFSGLDLVEPGLAECSEWQPHVPAVIPVAEANQLGAVGRKR